ncbi:MAG: hypothetical protein Aurels2KO_14670 [Aureliella sp.]
MIASNDSLIDLLRHANATVRMRALTVLCDGLVDDENIFKAVRDGWKEWGAEDAFPDFPMLSHFPVGADDVEEAIKLAASMADGGKLTDKRTRCAGKLLEQVVQLPLEVIEEHLDAIESVAQSAKIFFRVRPEYARRRQELRSLPLEQLSSQLDSAIETVSQADGDVDAAYADGLLALDCLRTYHPDAIDIGAAIRSADEKGPQAVSFSLAMDSLARREEPGLEEQIAAHLHAPQENVFTRAVEALVRSGTPAAAARLVLAMQGAPSNNRTWIVRGLQRIRAEGLAEQLHQLRQRATDQKLWLMLLVAELNQLDPSSVERVSVDLNRLLVFSQQATDAAKAYVAIDLPCEKSSLESALSSYLHRVENAEGELARGQKRPTSQSRKKLAADVLRRHRGKQ